MCIDRYPILGKYLNVSQMLNFIISALFLSLILTINSARADFVSNETSTTGMCPANHKMYYIGANPPASTSSSLVVSQTLTWTAGQTTKSFTFTEASGNKTFTIAFSNILDKTTTAISTPSNAESPFYDSLSGVTTSAINLVHNSPVSATSKTNHVLDVKVSQSTSKTGYKIQDLDSTGATGQVPYIEQVDVSSSKGQLTANNNFHTINASRDIVTARSGLNCGAGGCTIDAAWNYNIANIALNLKHNNTLSQVNSPHAVGYSDFYFCLAPPKLIIKKALNGNRVNDSDTKRDQFEITATGGSIATNSFTTTGTGSTITNGTSATLTLAENTSYTITERAINGTALGDIASYNATYTCTNATTGSTTVMPTAAMTYNATAKTRSFTLTNTTYGDEITCTITNSINNYNFSGTVFNDNGGITSANASNADIATGPYANNANYFNGVFDNTAPNAETVISDNDSTVELTNCSGTIIASQPVAVNGLYSINVSAAQLAGYSNLCLVEKRKEGSTSFPIRTTLGSRSINFQSSTYNYPNNNFGRVIVENSALVLEKEQAANKCDIISFTDTSLKYSKDALNEKGDNPDIRPGQCIAYRITATNRANIPIDNFIMQDILQKKGVNNATVTSVLTTPTREANVFNDGLNNGQNGTIRTISQTLPKRDKRIFYFNTKYGTTVDTQ
ncbi:hypothetical protein FW759_07885 [Psychrobacter sp. 1176_08]|uniref:hypothetical protein n=1 Tax=Psychrobacter sp. 1176_08 TaxID=2604452 RepID=UPI0040643DA4